MADARELRSANRDDYILTGLGLMATLPFYLALAVLMVNAMARRAAPPSKLDTAIPIDVKRRRIARPREA